MTLVTVFCNIIHFSLLTTAIQEGVISSPEDQKGAEKRRNSRPPIGPRNMWFRLVSDTLDINVLPSSIIAPLWGLKWQTSHLFASPHSMISLLSHISSFSMLPWSRRAVVTESMAYAILDLTIRGSTR